MQIDVELVGKHELHSAQRILTSRLLAQSEVKIFGSPRPVDCGRVDDLPGSAHDLNIVTGQVIRIGEDVRDSLFPGDTFWDVPVGTENDVSHRVAENGRWILVLLADHNPHCHLYRSVFKHP